MRITILLLVVMILAGCGGNTPASPEATEAPAESGAVTAVENYLTFLVNKDETAFAQNLCPAYEGEGMREFRSFGAVDASLKDVVCAEDGADGETTLVLCTGTIELVYQGEDTRGLDLSREVYRAVQLDGEWKVCGKGRGE
jgi:hypothetical protein